MFVDLLMYISYVYMFRKKVECVWFFLFIVVIWIIKVIVNNFNKLFIFFDSD